MVNAVLSADDMLTILKVAIRPPEMCRRILLPWILHSPICACRHLQFY